MIVSIWIIFWEKNKEIIELFKHNTREWQSNNNSNDLNSTKTIYFSNVLIYCWIVIKSYTIDTAKKYKKSEIESILFSYKYNNVINTFAQQKNMHYLAILLFLLIYDLSLLISTFSFNIYISFFHSRALYHFHYLAFNHSCYIEM